MGDHRLQEQKHEREEQKVRRDLTKLSNQCTITQLTDMMTDSEDNMTHNSTFADTDNESHVSEQDSDNLTAPATSTPRYETTANKNNMDTGQNDSDVDLDDLVAMNTDSVLRNQRFPSHFRPSLSSSTTDSPEPVRMSVSSVESGDMTTIIVTSPNGETFMGTPESQIETEIQQMQAGTTQSMPVVHEDGSDSDVTLGAISDDDGINEPKILKSQAVWEHVMPLSDDEDFDGLDGNELALRTGADRDIPLPSFEETDSLFGLSEVDLDDISRHGDDDEASSTTMDSEFLFCKSWDVTHPGPLFKVDNHTILR